MLFVGDLVTKFRQLLLMLFTMLLHLFLQSFLHLRCRLHLVLLPCTLLQLSQVQLLYTDKQTKTLCSSHGCQHRHRPRIPLWIPGLVLLKKSTVGESNPHFQQARCGLRYFGFIFSFHLHGLFF